MDKEFEYVRSKAFEKYKDKVNYAVTTRLGGVSKFPYESLNTSFKNLEDRQNSDKNLEVACKNLRINPDNVVCVFEEHTDKIVVITEENKSDFLFKRHHNLVYDAMITNIKNIPLLITIADCNAIAMFDTKNNIIANIHSGWKGTTKKIYLRVLETMQERFGTNPENVICVFSPSIQSCCWKTKDYGLVNNFKKYWNFLNEYVERDNEGWEHVDFPYVIKKDLVEAGIKAENIYDDGICTCCNVDRFFSYRKKTELNEPGYGVQASIIELI